MSNSIRPIEGRNLYPGTYLIEGIGDEVVQFVACVFIVLLVTAAWSFTSVREAASCRHLIVIIQWAIRRREERLMTSLLSLARSNAGSSLGHQQNYVQYIQDLPRTENVPSAGEHLNASAAFNATHTSNQDGKEVKINSENDQTQLGLPRISEHTNEQSDVRLGNCSSVVINIKLKFLNDTVKITEGKLHEKLGEFRSRSFDNELSQGKTVRMIFNGKVLEDDEKTLKACGFFNDCAVHCLIRQALTLPPPSTTGPPSRRLLSMSLFAFWGVFFVGMWYLRHIYAHLFSTTATTGLVLLSGLYIGSLIGIYFPDQDMSLDLGQI